MQRDMNLVREVLLRVEALDIPPALQVEGYSLEDIDRHLRLLVDGGHLTGKAAMDGVITAGLSWKGCEFLDSIRNPRSGGGPRPQRQKWAASPSQCSPIWPRQSQRR
jgi:hypothetical protein